MMTNDGGMNHPCDRYRNGLALNPGFGKTLFPNQVRQALQKLASVNFCPMKIEKPFGEDSNRDDATKQDQPHEWSPLLHVVNHPGLINEVIGHCKRSIRR